MAESGLSAIESAMSTAKNAVGVIAGEEPTKQFLAPPLKGPRSIDEATVDFANRLVLVARSASVNPGGMAEAWNDLLAATRKSFGSIEPKGFRQWMALPLQLPLSFGSLMAQSSLRGLHAGYFSGFENLPGMLAYAVEFFADLDIFVPLQYNDYLAQVAEQVRQAPEDAHRRFLLGRTLSKLGRYNEAVQELAEAAKDPEVRAAALRESSIAHYRAGNFSRALANGNESLSLNPSDDKTRLWVYLAAQKLGGYPAAVPQQHRMELNFGQHPSKVQFEEVASQIGLDKTSGGRGTAVFDMDGDGYLDVVISSVHGGCNVYHNNGDGTFTDVSIGSGLEGCAGVFCISVGDYNNDGRDDLYLTRMGFYSGESQLFRNNGDGTFIDVTKEAGVQNWGPAFTSQWVDYDCDGNLDLFVTANQGKFFEKYASNRLFHNNGDGTFTDVTEKSGITSDFPDIGSTWGDYNNDGYPDLFLSSSLGRAQLFRNNGDGTFTDVSRQAGIDEISVGFVALWCDYDNDGWLDLVQFVWSSTDNVLHSMIRGGTPPGGHPLCVYHNNRDGTFTLKSQELGLDECWGTMTGNAADLNNDGNLELVLGNGGPLMESTEPAVLYELDGDGKYHNTTFSAGLPLIGKGHGVNMADLAGDGRLSLIIADGGMYPGDLLTTSVYRPKTLPGNYLNVRLVGTRSNRNAIGARLRLESGGTSQYRVVSGGSGFGCLPLEQHFGLRDNQRIDSLEIVWPSGLKQSLENLPVNNTIQIVEGESRWSEVYAKKVKRSRAADRERASVEPATVAAR